MDKNELTDCAAQFCPFECDILFQDAKTPYFLKAYLPPWFSHFRRILIISTLYPFQSTSDSDHMPLRNVYRLSETAGKKDGLNKRNQESYEVLKQNIITHFTSGTDVK